MRLAIELKYRMKEDGPPRFKTSYWVAGEKLWIITEADRSVTTLVLPSEY
jgi:hypothetical protein